MTVNYKLDAMYELRKFIWQAFIDTEVFNPQEYYSENMGQEIVPIIPVQQAPELSQFLSGKKHIVYDKVGISYDDIWLICNEQVLLTIYATDYSEINEIRNLLIDIFRRMDLPAQEMNLSPVVSSLFKFHSVYVGDISPTAPSEELKGFLAADVILEVKYSRNTDNYGRYI